MGAVASKQPTRRDLVGIFESSIKVMAYTKMTERRDVMQHRQDLIGDGFDLEGNVTETPMSRTHQYRKVMKPLLERKRRARINTCLEELKDLMVFALQTEGESISKLEKADVLELTVNHLRKLKRQQMLSLNPALDVDRFHAGYSACAAEVGRVLASQPGVEVTVGARLMAQLGHRLEAGQSKLSVTVPSSSSRTISPSSMPQQPHSPLSDLDLGYNSGRESSPSPSSASAPSPPHSDKKAVWRPF